jgi:hypothetical protein
MSITITPVKKDLPSLNFLIYADSGAGKTVFASSARRVLFIAPEDTGLLSAAMMGTQADKIKIRTWKDFVEAYEYIYDNQEDLAEKYDWLVIDSVTKMQDICMASILEDERDNRIKKSQDPDVPQIQDYQKLYILVEKLVQAFNDIPINTLYTALARYAEDPDGNEFLLPMFGSNKKEDYRISMKLAANMTSYGHFKVEKVDKEVVRNGETKIVKVKQRIIYWEDTGAYRGKDRTTRLAPNTVLPQKMALQRITDIALGIVDKEGRPIQEKPKKAPAKKTVPAAKPHSATVSDRPAEGSEAELMVSNDESVINESDDVELNSVEA